MQDELSSNAVFALKSIIGDLGPQLKKDGVVELYKSIAARLSRIADKEPAWSWRYVQGVEKETIEPSKRMVRAILLLAGQVDETPLAISDSVSVTVQARTGRVKENAIIAGSSKECASPGCGIQFVPVVPWAKYCPICRERRAAPKGQGR